MRPVLRIRDLHKQFVLHAVDGRCVESLRGVDLDLIEGEHLTLAGTSGAGKSSLLKCVHRTYLIERGSVDYTDRTGATFDLVALSDSEMAELRNRDIGYVSQFLRSEPRRGVHEVVTRAAIRRGATAEEAADGAAVALRRMNIDERLWSTYPTLLSGGEKQRVNLAAGIVVPPRLLLLDEPVSALDPANRASVLEMIAELTGDGATVLSVFHDLDAIHRIADRVALLDAGRVVACGTPAQVLDPVFDRALDPAGGVR